MCSGTLYSYLEGLILQIMGELFKWISMSKKHAIPPDFILVLIVIGSVKKWAALLTFICNRSQKDVCESVNHFENRMFSIRSRIVKVLPVLVRVNRPLPQPKRLWKSSWPAWFARTGQPASTTASSLAKAAKASSRGPYKTSGSTPAWPTANAKSTRCRGTGVSSAGSKSACRKEWF